MKKVLFVTDELFLPPHNGSAKVYVDVARSYIASGYEVFALSFYRDANAMVAPEVSSAYGKLFKDVRFLPGWNGQPWSLAKLGYVVREGERWLTGNVFPRNPFLQGGKERDAVARWVEGLEVDEIYVHKIHAALLAEGLLDRGHARRVLDLHDDFLAKEEQYRTAYEEFFGYRGLASPRSLERKQWLRFHLGRINVRRSRAVEDRVLGRFDEIRVASRTEFEAYRRRPSFGARVRCVPWPVKIGEVGQDGRSQPLYDFGFIGSSDVMNVDAVLILLDRILPLMRARSEREPKLVIAGRVADVVRKLKGSIEGVTYVPWVADIQAFYASIGCAVVPLRFGAGVSIKLLEAIAAGVPVITTSVGARGLEMGERVSVNDSWDDFASEMLKVARARSIRAA